MRTPMRYVSYKCGKCGRTDTDKLFEHESPIIKINCFHCRPTNGKSDTMILQNEVQPEVVQ